MKDNVTTIICWQNMATSLAITMFGLFLVGCDGRGSIENIERGIPVQQTASGSAERSVASEVGRQDAVQEEAPLNNAVTSAQTGTEISFDLAVQNTSMARWLNRAQAVGVEPGGPENSVRLRFRSTGDLTHVLGEFSPRVGETYGAALNVASVEGGDARIRLMISRDCADRGDDLSMSIHNVTSSGSRISVSHTFGADYDCLKFVFQVLNASAENPITLDISPPTYSTNE